MRAAAAAGEHEQAHTCRRGPGDLRAILRDCLSASGYAVIEAVDGAESVEGDLERPDLVLMDIQLPVLDEVSGTCYV